MSKRKRKVLSITKRNLLLKQHNNSCGICNEEVLIGNFEVDHIIPYAFGGPDIQENLICLCPNCHRIKTSNFDHIVKRFVKYEAKVFSRKKSLVLIKSIYEYSKTYNILGDTDDSINIIEEESENSSDDYESEGEDNYEGPLTTSSPYYKGFDLPEKPYPLSFQPEYNKLQFDYINNYDHHKDRSKYVRMVCCLRCGYYTQSTLHFRRHINNKVPCIPRFFDITKEDMVSNYLEYYKNFFHLYQEKKKEFGEQYRIYSSYYCDFTTDNYDEYIRHRNKELCKNSNHKCL